MLNSCWSPDCCDNPIPRGTFSTYRFARDADGARIEVLLFLLNPTENF